MLVGKLFIIGVLILCVCSCFACTGCPVVDLPLPLYRSKLTRELVDREADLLKGDLLLHNILLIGSKADLLGNRVVLMPSLITNVPTISPLYTLWCVSFTTCGHLKQSSFMPVTMGNHSITNSLQSIVVCSVLV